MADRLTPLDASLLSLEDATTPMHVGTVMVLEPPAGGFDHDALVSLIEERVRLVPRFRQRLKDVPARLANPIWVDDADFDVSYHVRRSALPQPGTDAQLLELVGRLMGRTLDRTRPLWETYLVEGLSGGRVAIISKTHQAMFGGSDGAGGLAGTDLQTVLLDSSPTPPPAPRDDWTPAREPGGLQLAVGAVVEVVRRPAAALDSVRTAVLDVRRTASRATGLVTGLLEGAQVVARPAPASPLNVRLGEQRRVGIAATELDDYRRVRKAHGGTVNEVVLSVVAGALRGWLLSRGEVVLGSTTLRAMVPVSVQDGAGGGGNRVAPWFVDLPVGEASPGVRLSQVRHAMRAHQDSDRSVAADTLATQAGFAPPTIHALGARLASGLNRRLANLLVTNVPGPQMPLYAAGARLLASYPLVPLTKGQALSIGVTSYDGRVFYGLTADRDAVPDVEVLAGLIEESLAELVSTVR